jgi:hypothetical protein
MNARARINRACLPGPKARPVIARPEGPGNVPANNSQGLKGRANIHAAHVPPLQGGGICLVTVSRGFTPGYHITGFQPANPSTVNITRIRAPKARPVIARPEGPGNKSPQTQAL